MNKVRTATRKPRRNATLDLHPVGVNVPKREGPGKVTGAALYVDDIVPPGVLHGRTVRSTIARGRIKRIEFDKSFDWDGVVIADHRDIPGENVVALIEDDQPLLAAGEVRHAEEPILLLAHENAARAQAAVDAVRIHYEPLDPVLTMEESLAKKVLLYGKDNVFKEFLIRRGDTVTGFNAAHRIIEGTYRVGHTDQLYIENNGMIAEYHEESGLTVRGSLQCPYYVHAAVKRIFGLPDARVRVIQTVTGGGFGGKEEYPSMLAGHAALLAWKSGRPVKIVYDRLEDLAATTKRHPAVIHTRVGVKRDGSLLAQEIDIVMDGGAYVTLSPVVLSRGVLHAAGPYRCPNVFLRARTVATNTPPNGAFRGFGAPQTEFANECHMDQIALALRMDPVELRRRNAYREGDVTPTGQILTESVGALEVLERTAKRSEFKRKRARYARQNARAASAESRGKTALGGRRLRRGIGISLVYHGSGFTGSGEVTLDSLAAVELTPEGRPRIFSSNTEIGQGTITIYAQMVAEALGVPYEFVELEAPDTALVPNSGPTVASRSCMVVGKILSRCGAAMREKLESFAGRPIEGSEEFERVARDYLGRHGSLRIERRYEKPPGIEWSEETYQGDAYGVYSYACCVVEVEVDLDTFETQVLKVTTAQDVGKAIHPLLVEGQIQGGTAQALGYALLEEVRWKEGRMWNHQLTNYIIPTTMDTPEIDVEVVEVPYSHGPHGAKGVGELPMDAPAPALVTAIQDATGVLVPELPVSPERLQAAWQHAISAQRRLQSRRRRSG